MYPTLLANPDYTSIVNDRHFERLSSWLEDARAQGATIETVHPAGEDFSGPNARQIPLHIVHDATAAMIVLQEEVFGPIRSVGRRVGKGWDRPCRTRSWRSPPKNKKQSTT